MIKGGIFGLQFILVLGSISLLTIFNQGADALPTEDEIMDEIDKEAEKINDIMNDKIESHPGLGDIDGYCYNSVEALERCTDGIAEEIQPYYDEAGKRIWENID